MRKILLVAAILLTSASAQAAGSRSLSLASAGGPAAAQPAVTTPATQVTEAAAPAETPQYLERPSAVSTTAPSATAPTSTPATAQTPAVAPGKPAPQTVARTDKPKHKRYWTEGRIISELHRHGIYW